MSRLTIAVAALALAITPVARAQAPAPAAAAQPDQSLIWDLSELYATPAAWSAEADAIEKDIASLGKLEGTLGQSAGSMLAALDKISMLDKRLTKMYIYASMSLDQDLRVAANQERRNRAQALYAKFSAAIAFVSPEILKVGADKVKAFRAENAELERRFGFYLDDTLRAAPHTLGDEAERSIATLSEIFDQPGNLYDTFAQGEMPYPEVTMSTGEKVKLDQSGYGKWRQATNRADRKLTFDAFWGAWKPFEGTFGDSLGGAVKVNTNLAKVKKYDSALGAALFGDNMPEAVYRTLVKETNAALPTLHRYFKLRKKLLKIDGPLAYYDVYPPMFTVSEHFSVQRSKELTLAALAPLGDDYLNELKTGFAGRWMHIYPSTGKATGAYMNGGAYDVHPYLLLNHNDDYDSLSTFAHEWGHAVHTRLTNKNQPYEKADYSTFTAETASIMNEMLLVDYMIANAKTKEEKLAYLGEALESIRGTYFRQTMFAEFQLKLHDEVEAGRPLSGARMSELYCDLLKRYHGDKQGVMKIDPAYCIEWAFIPHFYRGFYVYQYATSIAGASLLAQRIQTGKPEAREVFLTLLKKGGSEYPYDIYKEAGIDMATPAPYRALAKRMNAIMDQIEKLEREK